MSGSKMRIFKNRDFQRWAKEIGLSDKELKEAVNEINKGLFEANLGGHILKKRVALHSKGKSGGTRTIVAFKTDKYAFFVYGYAKNVKSNISERELIAFKILAKTYFSFSDEQITQAINIGEFVEII